MCLPIIAAMGMQAASAALNNSAMGDVMDERNRRMEQERARQSAFGEEAMGVTKESQEGFTRGAQEQSIADAFKARSADITSATDRGSYVAPAASSGPQVVGSEIARKVADALKFSMQQGQARAKLGAYDANQVDNQRDLMESGRKVGQIQNFSRGSNAILPMELQAAAQEGHSKRMLADLFRMGGQAAGLYGMTSGGAPGATEIRAPLGTYTTPVGGMSVMPSAPRLVY